MIRRGPSIARTLFLGGLWGVAGFAQAIAQERISSDVSCTGCRVQLVHVTRLRTTGAPASFDWRSKVAQASRGLYYVAPTMTEAVFVHDSSGRFVGMVGSPGAGPGELSNRYGIRAFVIPGDSLMVYDGALGRRTVFDSEGAFVRTARVASSLAYAPLSNDRTAVGAMFNSAERIGLPLHILSPEGKITASLGSRTTLRSVRVNGLNAQRRIALGKAGTIWLHHVNSYRFEQWTAEGHLLGEYERVAAWFPPRQQITPPPSDPIDRLVDMAEDAGGLWTLTHDVEPDWRIAYGADFGNERPMPTIGQQHGMYDTVIEYLDPTNSRVVARAKSATAFHGFVQSVGRPASASPPLIFSLQEDEAGDIYIDIYALQLYRPH